MEYLDVVDENNKLTGKIADRDEVHLKGLWHREVAIIIVNSKKEFLLQKRASTKKLAPNMWSLTAGHIDAGENEENAALRETKEELGIKDLRMEDLKFLGVQKKKSEHGNIINNHFTYTYLLNTDLLETEFIIEPKELSMVKYFTISELTEIYENKEKYHEKFTSIVFNDNFFEIVKKLEKGGI